MPYLILFLLIAILILVFLIFETAPAEWVAPRLWIAGVIVVVIVLFSLYLMMLVAGGGVV